MASSHSARWRYRILHLPLNKFSILQVCSVMPQWGKWEAQYAIDIAERPHVGFRICFSCLFLATLQSVRTDSTNNFEDAALRAADDSRRRSDQSQSKSDCSNTAMKFCRFRIVELTGIGHVLHALVFRVVCQYLGVF